MIRNTLTEVEVGKVYKVQLNFGSYVRNEILEARNTSQGLVWVYSGGRQIFIDKFDVILNEVNVVTVTIEISTEVQKPEQTQFTFGEKLPESGSAIMILNTFGEDVWNYYRFKIIDGLPHISDQKGNTATFHSKEVWKYI